jgi:aerobic C4-dicarboxylate transport protein
MDDDIGLDVSMKETAVSIRRDGQRVWRGKCSSDPKLIADLIRKRAPSAKMENLGCESSVVGLVIPTGYSFNLDGTCIYLTMAAVFLAQATNTDLTLSQELGIILILLLTSKGAAGVTGSGFIVLAATLASVGTIPVASIALILGIDRFMSEARALTNLIGNGLATVVVAKWEGALDEKRLHQRLDQETDLEADEPETVKVEDDVAEAGTPQPIRV